MVRKALTILLLAAAVALGGCDAIKFLLYLIAPGDDTTRTVEADYKGSAELAGHSLAVVVYAERKVQFEYRDPRRDAQRDITRAIRARFTEDKEARDEIKNLRVISAQTVLDYQERNIYWDEIDKTQLGKALGADYVLFVSLVEFTTRAPMSAHMLHGTVTAEVSLYKTGLPEHDSRVYRGEDVRVAYPKNAPDGVQGYDDTEIYTAIVSELAQKAAWRFYKHKEPVEQ